MWGMMLWMVAFWVGVIVLSLALVTWLFPSVPATPRSTAREILDARYARGQLTQDQYRQMQRELAPEPRAWNRNLTIPILLTFAALILIAVFVGFGLYGGWPGPGYPGQPGGWPPWMWHMWGR